MIYIFHSSQYCNIEYAMFFKDEKRIDFLTKKKNIFLLLTILRLNGNYIKKHMLVFHVHSLHASLSKRLQTPMGKIT